ncbi:retrovirus-related pol polyprotein from transposon TNT 1-94 [Tanacetum coccineum]
MVAGQRKPEGQWTADERKAANLDQRLKSLIMSVLLDDQMNSVINCLTAKSTWDDLILYHEGPSDVKESRVMDLKYKALMIELVNDGINLSKLEINSGFINRLPKKWLSFCQSLRNTNHVKDSELASLFGKLKYEENLIDSIYETEKNKSLISATPLSTAFFSTSIVQDFQDSPDDEEDTRSSHEYLNDLEEEYQARALLAKSKRFFKKGTQSSSQYKPELRPTKNFKAKYNKVKTKLALLSSSASASKASTVKKKGLIVEAYEWDEEEVSSDDNEMVEVKVLMALAEDNNAVSKEGAKNSEWVKISMRKVHTLLEMEDNDDRKTYLDYLCIDLNYVEEQRINLLSKHRDLVHELNACKEQLLVLKHAKLDFLTMQHVNTEILKENKNLITELKELKAITETWLNSSNKVNQCISEQIPSQKKRIMGVDQLTKDPSSSGQKDLVFVKSLVDDTKVTIPGVERPWLSEAEGFILPNHDTGRILPAESQRNTTDPLVAVTDSSATDYDSADESLVCSTPLPPLKKLDGAEPISGPKTIKSILRSKSTFKAEALKGVIINEPSSAPAKGNKSSSASKVHSAPAGKLKSVKIKDDPPLAIVMKELNNLKLQVSKNQSSYSRSNQPQQVPQNELQNKYKTQFKRSYDLGGLNNHQSENCYKVLFCKRCEKTDHKTCDHVEYISTMNMPQHLKSLGRASSRSKIPRPSKCFFPPCTHCGRIDHLSNECLYYPICGLFGSYDHDTNDHNRIISLEREINPRNPQHTFKRCKVCGSSTHTTTDHYDIKWFKRGKALQAKKAEALKSTRAESSNANRSKTSTRSRCSRHMTGVKSYLHKYMEQSRPKVVFEDDSTCITKGYGSIKCNGIVFTKVAFVNGVKYNLISISQLCDAKYIVQFDEKRGTIFNSNKEVVMIAPRVRDVYVLDMTSSAQESCFFAKASENLNWLWHKRLAHLNFKTINKLAKQNVVIGLPTLVYSKDKPCSSCEKGKHHRASFKTKQISSIKKCLHLLHMDLFGPVTPRFINHEKYTFVIVDEYSRYTWVYFLKKKIQAPETIMSFIKRVENQNDIKVKQLKTDNVYIHNHKDHLGKFDEKADDGYLLGYSLVSKAFRVFNTRRQQTEETYHITFDESPDAIKFSKPSVDNINIAETERYLPDEYLHPYEHSQRYQTNNNDVSFIDPNEYPEPVVLETEVSSDQNGQIDQNDHND